MNVPTSELLLRVNGIQPVEHGMVLGDNVPWPG